MSTNIKNLLTGVFIMSTVVLASGQGKDVTLLVGGNSALKLQAPEAAQVSASNGYVNIHTTNMSLHIWAVPKAKKVNEAVPRVAKLIKSEFINFKITSSEDVTIAGAPARLIIGSGNEADDGDPGQSEVVCFVVGGGVFIGCVHGEFDDAFRARAPMMAVLQTAHLPP